jgi:hypothetical protein
VPGWKNDSKQDRSLNILVFFRIPSVDPADDSFLPFLVPP